VTFAKFSAIKLALTRVLIAALPGGQSTRLPGTLGLAEEFGDAVAQEISPVFGFRNFVEENEKGRLTPVLRGIRGDGRFCESNNGRRVKRPLQQFVGPQCHHATEAHIGRGTRRTVH